MNGIDNIAGLTLVTGMNDAEIVGAVSGYDTPIDNISNGIERAYKIQFVDPSVSGQYETGRGIWSAATSSLSRVTIKTSSNSGNKENFIEGAKVVYFVGDAEETISEAGTTAGTFAAGDDVRFDTTDIGDLDESPALTGTELVPIESGEAGYNTTTQDIAGSPLTNRISLARNVMRDSSSFSNTLHTYANTTTGTLWGSEPYQTYLSGTASSVSQLGATDLFYFGTASATTGTDTTGYAAIASTLYPVVFYQALNDLDTRFICYVTALPSVEAYTAQIGFTRGLPALATGGAFFRLSAASGNWIAVVRNSGSATEATRDTLVAAVANTRHSFRVNYDATALEFTFYIDGALVGTIPTSEKSIVDLAPLEMSVSIHKSAGTTNTAIRVTDHAYTVSASAPTLWPYL